jgi:tetratricopeptide (TPR) repeat protein
MTLEEAVQSINHLLDEGEHRVRQGQPGGGLERFQQALELIQEVQVLLGGIPNLPPDMSQYFATREATCLNNIGFVYDAQGDLGQALAYYQQALAIDEAVAPTSTATARDLNNIGGVYRTRGNLGQALEYYQQALAIDEAIAPTSTQIATRLSNIGSVYEAQGDLGQALAYFQRALTVFKATAPDSTQIASALNNIGGVYNAQGDLGQALAYYQQALAIDEAVAPTSTATARDLNSIGGVYRAQGDLGQALEYYQQALAIDEAIAPTSTQTATRLNNIGGVYNAQGNLGQALVYFRRALAIDEAVAPTSTQTATRLNNIGGVYNAQGNLGQALVYFRRALAVFQEIAPNSIQTASTISNIGSVYLAQGDLGQALACYQRALAVFQEIAPNSIQTASTISNIGSVYLAQGDLGQALVYFRRALAIDEAVAPTSTQTATRLNNIGGVYREQGDLGRALVYFRRALAIDEAIAPTSTATARDLNNIGGVYRALGDLGHAVAYFQRAVSVVENLRERAGGSAAREGLSAGYQNPYRSFILCLLHRSARGEPGHRNRSLLERVRRFIICLLQRGAPGDPAKAFGMAERTRARTLVERLREKTVQPETPEQQALLDEEQNLLSQFVAVNQRLQHPGSYATREARRADEQRREELNAALHRLEDRILQEIPAYAALEAPQPLALDAVRRSVVDPGTLLLSFCVAGRYVAGWAVRDESVPDGVQMFQVGETDDINKAVQTAVAPFNLPPRIALYEAALREATDPAARQRIEETLTELWRELAEAGPRVPGAWAALSRALWERIRPELKQGVTRLIVLPDGELNALPFELLPVGDNRRLGDLYEGITYAPSATALKELRDLWDRRPAPPADAPDFLGFGDPDFGPPGGGSSARAGHARLPGTRDEVERIAPRFTRPVTFYDGSVTRANLTPHLDNVPVLLAATHGLLNNEDPLGSGLVLAGGDIWEARELIGRRRPLYLELMVASACDSGRGKSRPGEGLLGFSTALMAVGVRCALVSLWPVDDNATCHFMDAFFEAWSRTRSVNTALKAARARVQQHPLYEDDPYYWAGFIAIGFA